MRRPRFSVTRWLRSRPAYLPCTVERSAIRATASRGYLILFVCLLASCGPRITRTDFRQGVLTNRKKTPVRVFVKHRTLLGSRPSANVRVRFDLVSKKQISPALNFTAHIGSKLAEPCAHLEQFRNLDHDATGESTATATDPTGHTDKNGVVLMVLAAHNPFLIPCVVQVTPSIGDNRGPTTEICIAPREPTTCEETALVITYVGDRWIRGRERTSLGSNIEACQKTAPGRAFDQRWNVPIPTEWLDGRLEIHWLASAPNCVCPRPDKSGAFGHLLVPQDTCTDDYPRHPKNSQ